MSLRIRLEGAYDLLERIRDECVRLGKLARVGWRRRLDPDDRKRLVALAEALGVSAEAYERVEAIKVTASERAELDALAKGATFAAHALEKQIDVLLEANAAEMSAGLEHKLRRLAQLAGSFELEPGEVQLCQSDARLSRAGIAAESGVVQLTQRRLLYDDASLSIALPLPAMQWSAWPQLSIQSGNDRFIGQIDDLKLLSAHVILLQEFNVSALPADVASELVPVIRQADTQRGWLLLWRDGLVFAPELSGIELLDAVVGRSFSGWPFTVLRTAALQVLDAVESLLPWAAEPILVNLANSNWNWSWPRGQIVTDVVAERLHLKHRSGSPDQPEYVVAASHVEACLRALG